MTTLVEFPESDEFIQERIQIAKYKKNALEIYLKNGIDELAKYLEEVDFFRREERRKKLNLLKDNNEIKTKNVFCPKCGYHFEIKNITDGKIAGGISGATAGAFFGAQVGIAMGPLGAIAGTIPGAILGGIFGKNIGNNFDQPTCPKCLTKFQAPNNLESHTSESENTEILGFYKPITIDEIIEESKRSETYSAQKASLLAKFDSLTKNRDKNAT